MQDSVLIGEDLPESFEIALKIIDVIVDRVGSEIYDNELYKRSFTFGLHYVLDIIVSTIECKYLRFDTGDCVDYEESIEPLPAGIENWARSTVPVHKKFKPIVTETKIDHFPGSMDGKSVKSMRSSFYRTGSIRKINKKKETIIQEGPMPFPLDLEKIEITEQEEYIRCKKEREWKRKQEEKIRLEAVKKEEEAKRIMLAMQMNGKSKDFTYDCNGKMILVNPFKNEKKLIESIDFRVQAEGTLRETPRSFVMESVKVESKKKKLDPLPVKTQSLSILDYLKLAPGVSIITNQGKTSSKPLEKNRKKAITKILQDNLKPSSSEPSLKLHKSLKEPLKIPSSAQNLLSTMPEHITSQSKLPPIPEKPNLIQTNPLSEHVKQYTKKGIIPNNIEITQVDLFNLEILSNPKWGENNLNSHVKLPKRMPKTLTARDKWEVYGHIIKRSKDLPLLTTRELWNLTENVKKPRDRPFIEKKHKKTEIPVSGFWTSL